MRCEIAPTVRNINVHRSLSQALRVIYCCAAAQPRAAISASCQNRNILLSDESSIWVSLRSLKVPPPCSSLLYSPGPALEALLSQPKDGVEPSSAAVGSVP